MKRLVLILMLGLLALSCQNGADMSPDFVLNDKVRLEVNGKCVLVYDPLNCQSAHSVDNLEFRVLKDDASDYFIVRLDALPTKEGECTSATLEWTSPDRYNVKAVSFRCVRLEGDLIWLWGSDSMGVVLNLL